MKRVFNLISAILVFQVLFSQSSIVFGLSQDQVNVFNLGIRYFNAANDSNSTGCDATLSGSDNEAKIWNYLSGTAKLNPVAVSGLMGNFQTESAGTWDPRINNGGDLTNWPKSNSIAYGLAQWLGGRQANLVSMAQDQGVIAGNLSLQLDFINTELNGPYKTTVKDPISSLSKGTVKDQVTQAAFIVYQSYEGPNDGSYPARESNAWDVYQKYSANQPVDGTVSSGCAAVSCDTGAQSGQPATSSNAAILCEAQKYKGIYYLSGGGHQGYSTFRSGCPENSISTAASASTAGDPGPCATDCSGLVSVAVDAVYNQTYNWIVTEDTGVMSGDGAAGWQQLPSISRAQPGDIVTRPGHVEIVQSINGGTVLTFGSHQTGTQTGPVTTSSDYWTAAWRWTGGATK